MEIAPTGNAAELIQAMLHAGLDVAEDNVDRELHGESDGYQGDH